jgi:hypothetical protein
MTAQDLKNKIDEIRTALFRGALSYDDAKLQAQPVIDEMNRRGREIAQKYGKSFRPFSFATLMR